MTDILTQYTGYNASILDCVQFVLVNDASPVPVPVPSDLDLNLLVLRIRENKPWNQAGARNLGVVYARSNLGAAARTRQPGQADLQVPALHS